MSREQVIAEELRATCAVGVPLNLRQRELIVELASQQAAAEQGGDAAWRFEVCERLGLSCSAGAMWTPMDVVQHVAEIERRAQASNAEMAAGLEREQGVREDAQRQLRQSQAKLSALLAGIAWLEQKWRVTNHQIGQGSAGNKARRQCADDLKAFREGVENG